MQSCPLHNQTALLYIYEVHFILETNSNVLVQQLKGSALDVLRAYIIRQLAVIKTYNFTVHYIKGTKNTITNTLSRKPLGPLDSIDREIKGDIKDQYNASLNQLSALGSSNQNLVLLDSYFQLDESLRIACFLQHKIIPTNLTSH